MTGEDKITKFFADNGEKVLVIPEKNDYGDIDRYRITANTFDFSIIYYPGCCGAWILYFLEETYRREYHAKIAKVITNFLIAANTTLNIDMERSTVCQFMTSINRHENIIKCLIDCGWKQTYSYINSNTTNECVTLMLNTREQKIINET